MGYQWVKRNLPCSFAKQFEDFPINKCDFGKLQRITSGYGPIKPLPSGKLT